MYWLRRTRTARDVVAATSDTTPTTTAETGDLDGPDRLGRFRGAGLVLMLWRRPWARSTASGDCGEIGSLRQITTAPAMACLQPCQTEAWLLVSVPACAPRAGTLTPSARIGAQFSSVAGCPTLIRTFRSTRHCLLWNALPGLRARTISRRNTGRMNRGLRSRGWLPAGPSSGSSQIGGGTPIAPRTCSGHPCRCASGMPSLLTVSPSKSSSIRTAAASPTTQPS